MKFSSKSLKNKAIAFSLAVTTFILISAFSLICFREVIFLSEQLSDKIEMERRICSSLIQQNYGLGNIIELRRTLQTLAESIKLKRAEFANDQGEVLWRYRFAAESLGKKDTGSGMISSLLIKALKRSAPDLDVRGDEVYCRSKVEFVNGSVLGYFSWSFSVWPLLSAAIARLVTIILVFQALIFFFAVLVYYFSSRILKPLPDFINKVAAEFKNLSIPRRELQVADMDFLNKAFDDLMCGWKLAQAESLEASKLAEIGRLAAQVAHDIRSPLVALDSVLKSAAGLPEEQRVMMRHAVNRIHDIANNLLDRNRRQRVGVSAQSSGPEEIPEARLLSSLIDPVVSEKRVQFESKRGIRIEFELTRESYGLFAMVEPVEFRRALSNLVNNAVEALGDSGAVSVSLSRDGADVVMKVSDNGKGVPPDILGRLGQKGETYGKAGGSGLGLYHAKTTVESWGGRLEIRSELGKGTEVVLTLPAARVPDDFVSELKVPAGGVVAVLDDDPTTHQLWDGRFASARLKENGVEVRHFNEPDALRRWVSGNPEKAGKAVCLFDYELMGYKETGLSLAEELGLCGRAILVTSRSEEKRVMDEARRLKMRIIPKGLADFVPLSVTDAAGAGKSGKKSAVLIDDDTLVHMNWSDAAGAAGVDLKAFKEPGPFLSALDGFPKDVPIYIDSELGNGVKGEDIAAQLKEKGFTDLTLETGHGPERFAHLPWLKVRGKESPWKG